MTPDLQTVFQLDQQLRSSLLFLMVTTLAFDAIRHGRRFTNEELHQEAGRVFAQWRGELLARSGGEFTRESRLELMKKHAAWTTATLAPITLTTTLN